MVFPRRRIAIFVHGCFWHRHPGCPKSSSPKSRVQYWKEKFNRNVLRDQQVASELETLGWSTYVIWECETKNPALLSHRLAEIFGIGDGSLASWT
jgi:DNA mismatch endonuclease (patch repair protein)